MLDNSVFRGFPLVLLAIIIVLIILLLWLRSRLRQQPQESRGERPAPHTYFVPGQINLVVEHAAGLAPERIAQFVQDRLAESDERLRNAFAAPERVVTFEDDDQAFSMVFLDVPQVRTPDRLIRLVNDLNTRIRSDGAAPPYPRDEPATSAPSAASDRQIGGAERLALSAATFNWLAGGAPAPDGSTSPGGRPVPPDPDPSLLTSVGDVGLKFWQFTGPSDSRIRELLPELGAGVDVYILDSAPCDIDRERAYAKWRVPQQPNQANSFYPPNELIDRLLGPNSPLEVIPAGDAHLLQRADFFHPDHNYVMTDHGLFVAGIIHAIAPSARLHLIETMNPYGVGTFESVVRGFALVAKQIKPDAKIIVNASLGFEVPQPTAEGLAFFQQQDSFWQAFTVAEIAALIDPLRRVCERFGHPSPRQPNQPDRHPYIGAIAAAGNDARPGVTPLPPARIPAAFDSVLGVGALKRDNLTPAEYSNRSDTPMSAGIATFGGELSASTIMSNNLASGFTDAQHGIVSLYIGTFPDGTPNRTGWACWAGTSFATPIISGFVAALMSKDHTFSSAVQALRNAAPGNASETLIGEVFPVLEGNTV